jgi:hypothetical protein
MNVDYLSHEEKEVFWHLSKEERDVVLSHSEDVQQLILHLPEGKRRSVLRLPVVKFNQWIEVYLELVRLKRRRWGLENALDNGTIPDEQLNEANTNIRVMGTQINGFEKQEQELLNEGRDGKVIDSSARPGAVSIRRAQQDRPYTLQKRRQKK